MAISAKCPSCYTRVSFGLKPEFYQRVVCQNCDTVLRIVKINPPVLDWDFESDNENNNREDYLSDEILTKKGWDFF